MNKECRKYIRDCKGVFPFFENNEKKFLKNFLEGIYMRFDENQNLTYNDLVQELGTPKEIMLSYIQNCEEDYIVTRMNVKRITRNIFVTLTSILIIGLSIVTYLEWRTLEESKNQQIITEEVILEQE